MLVIAVLVVSVYAYAFTSFGRPPGTCPPIHLTIGTQSVGNVPFSIVPAGDAYRPSLGTGTVAWCIYSSSGVLERSYLTNRILGSTASSSDGQYLAAAGYRVSSGPAGFYGYGAVYLFDHDGFVKWNVSTTREIFSVHTNSNGSVIVANDPELLYINNQGNVLWNYSNHPVTAAALANDGANVVAGISDVLFSGYTNHGGELVMFSAKENVLWNFSIPDQQFDSTTDVAVSSGHVAAGVSASGFSGTLYYFDLQGNEIWSRHLDSAILSVNFDSGGSTISTLTNWDLVKFDLQGNVVSNQTRTSF
ncbi:hypothetical protein AUI06_08190 [archaeon 13_2_20CM_2_52_21]|nr:MAG: hypothetical protein AUI06_08190 [archaeon 13_2_20CM_2_52_21]